VRNEKGFSLLDVQRHSRNQIAGSYVSRIENGIADPEGVTPKKLQALAKGLQVSEDEIFAVARGLSPNGEEPGELEHEVAVMFYGWKDASEEDRAVTLEALKMIAESFQRRRNKKKK
jgi:transcriptional regulator with XRE-family HTH domain